jgi:hypothetical protein
MGDEQKPQDEQNNQPNQQFNFHGDVKGTIVNQGGNMTISGGNFSYVEGQTTDDEVRQQVQTLLDQLLATVEQEVAEQDPEAAAKIKAEAVKVSEEVKKDEPSKARLEIRGEDLVAAAKNIAAVAPIAVNIAKTLLLLA